MKFSPYLYIILILVSVQFSFSQTDSLRIHWNINPEPDMWEYRLFRSVNSLTNFQISQTVSHPGSLAVDRNQIFPGNLYAYTLCAVDSAGNQSQNSDTVSVGLPEIGWTLSGIISGETTSLALSSFLSDPDNNVNQLQLIISNAIHLTDTIVDGNLHITPDPLNFIGEAHMDLTVNDQAGFWDQETGITLSVIQKSPVGIIDLNLGIPTEFELSQNYPNPFNPVTHIRFGVPKTSRVKIELYNLLGQKVDTILENILTSGYYVVDYDASSLPSGIYLYRLEADGFSEIKRMILLK